MLPRNTTARASGDHSESTSQSPFMPASSIRWFRILLAALAGEFVPFLLLILYVLVYSVTFAEPDLPEEHYQQFAARAGDFFGPVGGTICTYLAALWAVRPLNDRFLLHAALVGLLVALIGVSLLLAAAAPFRWIFVGSYTCKFLAAVAAGHLAHRRRDARP